MTLVVVALATVVLTWGLGQVSNSRVALTGAVNDRINRMQETTNIEDVQMLSSTTMRVYVRNIGSIQVLIDAVYVNNANTPVLGTCPAGSFQSGTVSVPVGGTTAPVTLSTQEPSTAYTVSGASSTPLWIPTVTLSATSSPTQTTFTLNFSSAPTLTTGVGTVVWYTNYASCASASSSTKLNLAINAVGALDVTISPAPVAAKSGTASGAQTSTTLQDTTGFVPYTYTNDVVWITSGTGVGQCRTISSITGTTVLNLASAWAVTPVAGLSASASAYSISSSPSTGPPVCSGNTYTVTASTNRGTTFTGSFTV